MSQLPYRAVIYLRTDSADYDNPNDDPAIQYQRTVCQQVANKSGAIPVSEVLDYGYRGGNLNRPGLDHIRDLAKRKEIEAVVCSSSDRIAYDEEIRREFVEQMQAANVRIYAARQKVSDTTAATEAETGTNPAERSLKTFLNDTLHLRQDMRKQDDQSGRLN